MNVARLHEMADQRQRPKPSISLGDHAILADDALALESFQRNLIDLHGLSPQVALGLTFTGDAAQVAERLAAYAAAGADAVTLSLDGADRMHAEVLGAKHPASPRHSLVRSERGQSA